MVRHKTKSYLNTHSKIIVVGPCRKHSFTHRRTKLNFGLRINRSDSRRLHFFTRRQNQLVRTEGCEVVLNHRGRYVFKSRWLPGGFSILIDQCRTHALVEIASIEKPASQTI